MLIPTNDHLKHIVSTQLQRNYLMSTMSCRFFPLVFGLLTCGCRVTLAKLRSEASCGKQNAFWDRSAFARWPETEDSPLLPTALIFLMILPGSCHSALLICHVQSISSGEKFTQPQRRCTQHGLFTSFNLRCLIPANVIHENHSNLHQLTPSRSITRFLCTPFPVPIARRKMRLH